MGGACSAHGGEERCTQGFGAKPEVKRRLERSRRRWVVNVKMDLQEVGCGTGLILLRIGTCGGHL